MKRFLAVAVALAAAAVMLLVLTLGAGASSDKRFVLSWRGSFTGSNTGAGTFAVGGALSDSGTFDSTFNVGPGKDGCDAVTGGSTYTAPDGGFTEHLAGLSCSPSPNDPRATFDGRFQITSGTGAYAGLSGKGTITSLADFTDGTFTGVHDGTAHFAH
jgi:hypothetical protein